MKSGNLVDPKPPCSILLATSPARPTGPRSDRTVSVTWRASASNCLIRGRARETDCPKDTADLSAEFSDLEIRSRNSPRDASMRLRSLVAPSPVLAICFAKASSLSVCGNRPATWPTLSVQLCELRASSSRRFSIERKPAGSSFLDTLSAFDETFAMRSAGPPPPRSPPPFAGMIGNGCPYRAASTGLRLLSPLRLSFADPSNNDRSIDAVTPR